MISAVPEDVVFVPDGDADLEGLVNENCDQSRCIRSIR